MGQAELPAELVEDLVRLFPRARGRPDVAQFLVRQLVDAERHRRGEPDAVTGASHALALTQGTLLKEEYDLSTHGHAPEWTIGAVVVDPVAFTLFNMHHGFPAGDAALRALARALGHTFPTARVVRLHGDGFAVLLGPTSGRQLEDGDLPAARTAAREALLHSRPRAGDAPPFPVDVTVGGVVLSVVDPPTWHVLGPLVWAECERALVISRRAGPTVLRRSITLDGRLPPLPDVALPGTP